MERAFRSPCDALMLIFYADRLARRGHDLVLVARSRTQLDEVARRVTEATGRTVAKRLRKMPVDAKLLKQPI